MLLAPRGQIAVDALVLKVPKGVAKVSKKGKVAYKGELPGGGKVKVIYTPKKGVLKVSLKKTDLSSFGPGEVEVSCECGTRFGSVTIELETKGKKTLVTVK